MSRKNSSVVALELSRSYLKLVEFLPAENQISMVAIKPLDAARWSDDAYLSEQIKHDDRYAIAEEYLEVVYRLLEGSWEDDAVVLDGESLTYTDPDKVHEIGFEGEYYTVAGPHLSEPSAQRSAVLAAP